MRRTLLTSALLVAGFLGGCDSPTVVEETPNLSTLVEPVNGVALKVGRQSYRFGEKAELQLVNGSSGSIGYNTCSASRELQTGSTWLRIESLRLCDLALYSLKPGETVSFVEEVGGDWQPGTYRIVLRIERFATDDSVYLGSKTFTVGP